MSKELKALLESELLNDETKASLKEAVGAIKEEAIVEAKKELEVEYAKKMLAEKEEIAKKMYALINEAVAEEVEELKADIEHYKKIEPTYAKKLEDFKAEYSQKMTESFEGLVESAVKDEIKELHEDLVEAKHNHVGMQIFEAFKETFEKLGISEDVKEVKERLEKTTGELKEHKEELANLKRERILEGVLSNLSGSKREVMKTILENVTTDKLEERYNETIESVLEDKKEVKKDEEEVINESDETKANQAEYDRLRALIK